MISWINKKRNKKGFTLIELIVVVAILGILIALAIPRFATIRANSQAGTNESVAASILAAAEIYWVEKATNPLGGAGTGATAHNLVDEKYLKEWPADYVGDLEVVATDSTKAFTLTTVSDGVYSITYPVPDGADGTKYPGKLPKTVAVVNP